VKVRARRRRGDMEELTHIADQGVATLGDILTVLEEIRDELREIREGVDRLGDPHGSAR
jgi:hypothetical protein